MTLTQLACAIAAITAAVVAKPKCLLILTMA
jgi:hypothetical protein